MPRQVVGTGSRRKLPPGTGKVHVRRGDRVRVIRGNYAGQEGTVLKVLVDRNRVIVEGVNERTRHVRPTQENPEGGRIKSFEPIHASNVMLIDPSSGEPSRARKRTAKDGSKERIATRSGNPIPKTTK
jgi:large subunit ribosomal protein L24